MQLTVVVEAEADANILFAPVNGAISIVVRFLSKSTASSFGTTAKRKLSNVIV